MRILLLVTAFNGLSQRIYEQLKQQNHYVNVVLATNELEVRDSIHNFDPALILCPFLKHKIPEDIWRSKLCVIVHPGIKGDRGPSSLDWAIIEGKKTWGVTLLQACEDIDAGDIWATGNFKLNLKSKASLYRQEVTKITAKLVAELMAKLNRQDFKPSPLCYNNFDVQGKLKPHIKQTERTINWLTMSTQEIYTAIQAADSFPGVLDEFYGIPVHLYGVHHESEIIKPQNAKPKDIIAQRLGAILVSTIDGMLWISHLKQKNTMERTYFKLPASQVLGDLISHLPELELPILTPHNMITYKEVSYLEFDKVGYLYFNFHNGAMSTRQCQLLLKAYNEVKEKDVNVIVLMGGDDFWSNGIHLNSIEASLNPAEESWKNINAINDLVEAIIKTDEKLTVSALRNNAGAGGAMMALASDFVFMRSGVVLNPHYKSMGLYGSEYWTYTLPRRVGYEVAKSLTQKCLPLGSERAFQIGLVDTIYSEDPDIYIDELSGACSDIANGSNYESLLFKKIVERISSEKEKTLQSYRDVELREMKNCFYDSSSSYHELRKQFVYKDCAIITPQYLIEANKEIVLRSEALL